MLAQFALGVLIVVAVASGLMLWSLVKEMRATFAAPKRPVAARARRSPQAPVSGKAAEPLHWREGGGGFVAVVGESHYQDTLRGLSDLFELVGRDNRVFMVRLVPEPTNAYDSNAVVVQTEGNVTIGYLRRELAADVQKLLMAQPAIVTCQAQLRGGDNGQQIGVVLDFEKVHELRHV